MIDNQESRSLVGVRFRAKGKVYTFDGGGVPVEKNDTVIVDTENGEAIGTVVTVTKVAVGTRTHDNMKFLLRKAGEADLTRAAENSSIEKEAFQFCRKRIAHRNLAMKLVEVSYLFNRSKLVFYFAAESRVDFRGLVKDLVAAYRTRIELRQIWVRSEARFFGGIGMCGRELCCVGFLESFGTVSIKMAKEQNMLLNPEKISGLCGRLMCCLAFEYDSYRESRKNMPRCGRTVVLSQGRGKVVRQNVLEEKIFVDFGEGREAEVSVKDVISVEPARS
ncbi:MAG: stage 0 sporulation protein [Syntrophales bacterium]|nr:stage 0 sporulation protein [Syntrophales bacterium]MCK9527699.1 stage 0 sporulation protein [Syntrophales bacterium]MDX9921646.1 regulatory iron-sulfur-containing complex subunit RicT [Syntrophales bacterium]